MLLHYPVGIIVILKRVRAVLGIPNTMASCAKGTPLCGDEEGIYRREYQTSKVDVDGTPPIGSYPRL